MMKSKIFLSVGFCYLYSYSDNQDDEEENDEGDEGDDYDNGDDDYQNKTSIQLSNIRFAYYSVVKDLTIVVDSQKFKLSFYNDKWVQIGNYVYVLDFYEFQASKISYTTDEKLSNLINDFKVNEEHKSKILSGIFVFKIQYKLLTLPNPKLYIINNEISSAGYDIDIYFYGEEEKELDDLIILMASWDEKQGFSIYLEEQIDFTNESAKQFLDCIKEKNIARFSYTSILNNAETKVLINFFKSPKTQISSMQINIADHTQVASILKCFEHKYKFTYAEIKTKKVTVHLNFLILQNRKSKKKLR